jgi:hypothetical protein
MVSFIKRATGLCCFIGSAGWTYRWEAIRGVPYEQAWLKMSENADIFFHYGIPAVLVAIGIALFILSNPKKKDRRREDDVKAPGEPDRIPLVELRKMAADAGWNINVHTSDDTHNLTERLNQAAADGLVNFWGRKYEYDFGEGSKSYPLVSIPIGHFVDRYLFSSLNIFGENVKNFYIHTGKIGKTMREQKGKIFQDIHADRKQLADWIDKNRNVR